MGKEGSNDVCPHLTVLPDGEVSKPAQLIRVHGEVTSFPSRKRLSRNGRERCGLSTDGVDRMIGPGQVRQFCRGAIRACRVFEAGSVKEVLRRQQIADERQREVVLYGEPPIPVSSRPVPRQRSLEEDLLFGSPGSGTHSFGGEW